MKCRSRNNHINKILTIYDMGYKNEWSILAPPWKVGKVSFDITI
ncbi:hypothetical protein [Pseudoalteromonas phage C7]|nr:hypothetical protein PP587_gp43 [Pseudoalteromonas phage C7]QAY17997.1 hypothetical protein [Pseudoalteromonas phage C7]